MQLQNNYIWMGGKVCLGSALNITLNIHNITYHLKYYLRIILFRIFQLQKLQSSRQSVCTYVNAHWFHVTSVLRSDAQMQTNPPVSSVAGHLYVISSCELCLLSTSAGLSL